MQRTWLVLLAAIGVSAAMLVGCDRAKPRVAVMPPVVTTQTPPADSPLTDCVDPSPHKPKPIDTTVAGYFAGGRIQRALSVDGGAFHVEPAPHNVVPRITAAAAFCNLLAGATAENSTVLDAVGQHGMSFGLGVVTVADSVLKTGPQAYTAGGRQQTASLQPYHARLAWIAVIKPDVVSSCPAMNSAPTPARKTLPGYQILAIDADSGAAGILYSAKTNALCNFPGYRAANVAPAVEFVSVPWTLVKRGPGPQSASITYQPRPCDSRALSLFGKTMRPAAFADRDNPAEVRIVLERLLISCGPAATVPLLLRSSDLKTDLPPHLIHAPTGASDVAIPN